MKSRSFIISILTLWSASADTLSFKFQDTADTAFAEDVIAGAPDYADDYWNFLQTDWSGGDLNDDLFLNGIKNGSGNTTASLLDITYGETATTVHYDSANTWRSGAGNADANATIMNGYLDDGNDDQPFVNFSLTASALPVYKVVVYINGDAPNTAVGRYWIEEWTDPLLAGTVITDQVAILSNGYTGTFLQAGSDFEATATPANVDEASGNYIVFSNLTARNFRVRSSGNGDPEDAGRGPLNAIQILDDVDDPEGDNDSDGLLNLWEIANGFDPDSDIGEDGADGDPDMDNLTNFQEQTLKTNPRNEDSDDDNLNDDVETNTGVWDSATNTGTDPLDADSDDDTYLDGVENNSGNYVDATNPGTDPNKLDTDEDGLPDGWEIDNMIDPTDDGTTDVANGPDGDPDSDVSTNLAEFTRGTDPQDNDSDDDTLFDGWEDNTGIYVSSTMTGTDPLNNDTDGDSLFDNVETADGNFVDDNATGTNPNLHDTDSDGYFDEQEIALETDPSDASSKPPFPTPLGYWAFDDQGAATTADFSPNGNDATITGGATYVAGHTGGPSDFALDLDGVDDAATTSLTLSNIGTFTMAGWIKMSVDQTAFSGLFGQNDILEFGFDVPGNVHLWSNPGGPINTPLEATNEWVHIAFVGDTSGRTIFINGEPAVTGVAGTPLVASDFFFNIGGGGIFRDTANYFQGQIDDVGVWEVSMSPQLIQGLANGTISPVPGLNQEFAITEFTRDGNDLTFKVQGTVQGVDYIIEESDSLLGPWEEITDFVGAQGAAETEVPFQIEGNAVPKNFFRATVLENN
ncbi:hypothetical protein N8Z81_02110 [Akkermansiaceae bacterium]|nr:hypothetical protein [Akkermansiaceae bacterium]